MRKYLYNIAKTEGFSGFYKGLSLSYIKIIPYNGILFALNEKLRNLLNYN